MTDFKAVKGSSSAEERSAAYQPGLLLLLAGAAAVTILFAAVACVAVTLRCQASFTLISRPLVVSAALQTPPSLIKLLTD